MCETEHTVLGPLPRSQTQQMLTDVSIEFPRKVRVNDIGLSTFQLAKHFPTQFLSTGLRSR